MNTLDFLQAGQNKSQLLAQDYLRDQRQSAVMHFGVGAFHRAHQAVFFDRLMSLDDKSNWGITGINIRSNDSNAFNELAEQHGEYILKTMDSTGATSFEHIRSILELIDGAKQPLMVDQLMADTAIQLVTCTVTEGGYYLDENHQLMLQHPDIEGDLKGQRNTLYAFLYAGLKERSEKNKEANITLLCCDNLRENGHLLRTGLIQFINAQGDSDLVNWLEEHVSFPCSMVDRITPKPDAKHVTQTQEHFAITDKMTVMAEDYIQWVIEDNFAGQRPNLDKVGAEFVADVTPYEEAKIRILNAGHTSVTYQAALKGLTYFDKAMENKELAQYFTDFINEDVIPALGDSIVNLDNYRDIIKKRFQNTHIGDTVERICSDGYAKLPIFLLPTVKGAYKLGRIPKASLQAISAWFVFFQHYQAGNIPFHYYEPSIDAMSEFTNDGKGIQTFVGNRSLWGDLLDQKVDFEKHLTDEIRAMLARYPL